MSKAVDGKRDHELLTYIVRDSDGDIIARCRFLSDAILIASAYEPRTVIRIGGKTIWTVRADEPLTHDEIAEAATKNIQARLYYKNFNTV